MVILIDSNIPMYLVGRDASLKLRAAHAVERAVLAQHRLVTDAEVFQEILHRYLAIGRRELIHPAYEVLQEISDAVLPITEKVILMARDRLVVGQPGVSARDAVHLAVMRCHDIRIIMSFDRDFDAHGVQRWLDH
ncbi:MAG: type II toxin-antitoxin system VapC family toxin [Polyangiales bacterium]